MSAPWELCFMILSVVFFCGRADKPGKLQSCQVAQLQCHARSGCQMALNNFFVHCHLLVKGEEVNTCPTDCKHALVSLLSTEDKTGFAFINCDCREDHSCTERKKRVEICQLGVLESMHVLQKDSPPVTCNLARWICEADTSCLVALQYYYAHCSRLFSGIRCTSKCRNSLEILSRQAHASKLRSCLCDGSEDYNCQALKVNTETLCLHRKRRRRQKSRANSTEVTPRESADALDEPSGGKRAGRGMKRSKRRKRRNRQIKWEKDMWNTRRQLRKATRKQKKQTNSAPQTCAPQTCAPQTCAPQT